MKLLSLFEQKTWEEACERVFRDKQCDGNSCNENGAPIGQFCVKHRMLGYQHSLADLDWPIGDPAATLAMFYWYVKRELSIFMKIAHDGTWIIEALRGQDFASEAFPLAIAAAVCALKEK